MSTIILNENAPMLDQIEHLYDQDISGDTVIEITSIVNFHDLLEEVEEDDDLTIEEAIHNKLIGYGVPYDPCFVYKRVVSGTELEITYQTRFDGLSYIIRYLQDS